MKPNPDVMFFMMHYGAAMSQWAGVELQLLVTFVSAARTDQSIASAIFHRFKSPEMKFAMIDGVMHAIDRDAETMEKWKATSKLFEKAIRRRNKLAHYQVVKTLENDGSIKHIRLEPHWTLGKPPKDQPETFSLLDLEKIIKEFQSLERSLSDVNLHLLSLLHSKK